MSKIKHHLTEPLLMGYAAGTLPEAFNVVVATHISMCDDCRAALAEYDAIGGEVMVSSDPVEVAEASLAATLALIDQGFADQDRPVRKSVGSIIPQPLQDYVDGDIDSLKWRKIGGGVSQLVLDTSADATVRLLRIPGGTAVPDHGHNGTELTLVLQGAFVDEQDRFGAGDVEVANEELHHTPVAEQGADCICLAATDAPLRFNGIVPRIAQRFIGI
ncbi:ChrR family anti-sigma-E factor [Yoonia litorea]|uniref:Anti-ECFsigma factor, ChrR n=1 Tax=Yoonia litorea TaxID=1123755 RepID=A0A1I6MWZ9_9RHOB|nr:ChrR family anti-sigma-E factor [Yoonia litorea]SFS20236.1 anti-ECFsigma factor, ChrR [Yoonia litorea]